MSEWVSSSTTTNTAINNNNNVMRMTKILRPDMYSRPYRSVAFIIVYLRTETDSIYETLCILLCTPRTLHNRQVLHLIASHKSNPLSVPQSYMAVCTLGKVGGSNRCAADTLWRVTMTCWLTGFWSTQAKMEGIILCWRLYGTKVAIAVSQTTPWGNQAEPSCM